MNEKGLGKRLQLCRLDAGLTQQQLCQLANLSFSTLTKIERGAIKSPSIFTITNIAKALNLTLDELIGKSIQPKHKNKVTKTGIKFIYFDVNGTLVNFYHQAFSAIAEDYSLPIDAVEMAFLHVNDPGIKGKITIDQINSEVGERLGVDHFDWTKYYLSFVKPTNGMKEVVSWVADNYGIGLITNTIQGLLPAMIKKDIIPNLDYDDIIDSSEVGLTKPDDKIFHLAERRSGFVPNELLLVDDNSTNVVAAERLGWHVFWFDFLDPTHSVEMLKSVIEMN